MKWLTLGCLLLLGGRSSAQTYSTGYERARYQAPRTYARPAYQAPAQAPSCLTCDHCQVPPGNALLSAASLDLQARREGPAVQLDFGWEMEEAPQTLSLWYRPASEAGLYQLKAWGPPFPQQFFHPDPAPEVGYYQLRALSADGATVYSPLREVAAWSGLETLKVHPNPASSVLHLQLPGSPDAAWRYTLRDLQGRQVRQGFVPADATLRDLERLAPGLYWVEVSGNGQAWQARWIKQ